jgi:hypothetical protein
MPSRPEPKRYCPRKFTGPMYRTRCWMDKRKDDEGKAATAPGPRQVELSRKVFDSGAMAALTCDKKSIRGALDA